MLRTSKSIWEWTRARRPFDCVTSKYSFITQFTYRFDISYSLLIRWSRVLENITLPGPVNKFPMFCGTWSWHCCIQKGPPLPPTPCKIKATPPHPGSRTFHFSFISSVRRYSNRSFCFRFPQWNPLCFNFYPCMCHRQIRIILFNL